MGTSCGWIFLVVQKCFYSSKSVPSDSFPNLSTCILYQDLCYPKCATCMLKQCVACVHCSWYFDTQNSSWMANMMNGIDDLVINEWGFSCKHLLQCNEYNS